MKTPNASQPIKFFFASLKGEEQSIPSAVISPSPSTGDRIIRISNTTHGTHYKVLYYTCSYIDKKIELLQISVHLIRRGTPATLTGKASKEKCKITYSEWSTKWSKEQDAIFPTQTVPCVPLLEKAGRAGTPGLLGNTHNADTPSSCYSQAISFSSLHYYPALLILSPTIYVLLSFSVYVWCSSPDLINKNPPPTHLRTTSAPRSTWKLKLTF